MPQPTATFRGIVRLCRIIDQRVRAAGYIYDRRAGCARADKRFLSRKKRRRADATAEVNLIGLGLRLGRTNLAPGLPEARAPRALVGKVGSSLQLPNNNAKSYPHGYEKWVNPVSTHFQNG
jgi:hypothetical protein